MYPPDLKASKAVVLVAKKPNKPQVSETKSKNITILWAHTCNNQILTLHLCQFSGHSLSDSASYPELFEVGFIQFTFTSQSHSAGAVGGKNLPV